MKKKTEVPDIATLLQDPAALIATVQNLLKRVCDEVDAREGARERSVERMERAVTALETIAARGPKQRF